MRFCILAFYLGAMICSAGAETRRPNILIITTDDQGYADLSCMGSKDIRTPNLDALARRGALCIAFYSNSPVCSPSRAALLTGRYPAQTGVTSILSSTRHTKGLRPDVPTMASVLKEHGYNTFHCGKWHLGSAEGSRPMDRGFNRMFGFYSGCIDFYSHLYYWSSANPTHDLWEDGKEVWHNGEYLTDLITEKAITAIEGSGDRPFFGYVAYNAPHYPLHAPAEVVEKFEHLPAERRMMAAMLWVVDQGVGRIVQRLENLGKLENTLIFFMSDNGPSRESRNWLDGNTSEFHGGSAEPWRGAKFTLWEGGIRVPAIFYWPARIPEGQTIEVPMMAVDVFPTVLAAAGVNKVPGLAGVNLLPLLESGVAPKSRDFFWEHDGEVAMRREEWKLLLRKNGDAMLVNLKRDPGETRDVKPENPALAQEMKERALEWRAAVAQD